MLLLYMYTFVYSNSVHRPARFRPTVTSWDRIEMVQLIQIHLEKVISRGSTYRPGPMRCARLVDAQPRFQLLGIMRRELDFVEHGQEVANANTAICRRIQHVGGRRVIGIAVTVA